MHFDARTPVLQLNSRLVLSLESTKLDSDYSLAVVVYPPIFAFFALFVSCIVDQELVACKFCIKLIEVHTIYFLLIIYFCNNTALRPDDIVCTL